MRNLKMQPQASIITIGDEILIGQIVDTNSAFIGSTAADAGIRIAEINSISDNAAEIKRAIAESLQRNDIVVVTGGLGPTKDDITKKSLAELFGVGFYRDQPLFEHVRNLVESRGIEFNELNQSQADVPEGFEAMSNPIGTAPGLFYKTNGKLLFCMPGVPFEMKRMFTEEILPRVAANFELDRVVRRTVMTVGIPESILASRIAEWENNLGGDLSLAYLPNPAGVRLRLSSKVAGGLELIDKKFEELQTIIPEGYLGDDGATIIGEVARLLALSGKTLAVAESCSGGALAAECTKLSGSSAWFKGGVVAYCNDIKHAVLGVDTEILDTVGAVSGETVEAMASGVRKLMGSDYAIATSGIAGPTGATDTKALGDVYIAISGDFGTEVFFRNFGQPRHIFVDRLVAAALNYLRLKL